MKPQTLTAFGDHIRQREEAIQRDRVEGKNFLWTDESPERLNRVKGGQAVVRSLEGKGAMEVEGGLIHDWIGAVFIPNTTLAKTVAAAQNYNNHKNVYQPEVIDSKLLERNENKYKIHYRLLKKKVITVVLNTQHEVSYFPIDATHEHSRSYSTRIAEVEDGKELEPGHDHGFLWKLNSYWRFQERDGGVYVECEAVSLTRGVPTGVGWLINPIVRDLPRESLSHTLEALRGSASGG